MPGNVDRRVKAHRHAAIETDRRIEYAVEIVEGDAALRLIVDEEAQRVGRVEIEENTDGRSLLHSALGPLGVTAAVHKP